MNLEQLAYVAEIIAALAVIASLVYVARELSQTNSMMRVSAANERIQREYELLDSLIADREVAELWCKGDSAFASLDAVDQQRLVFFERRAIILWHHLFQLRQQGLYSDEDWHWNEWIIQHIGLRQAVRAAWTQFRDSYTQPFRDYIDEQFVLADKLRSDSATVD